MPYEFQFLDTDNKPVNLDDIDKEFCEITGIQFNEKQYNPAFMYLVFECRIYGSTLYDADKPYDRLKWDSDLKHWLENTSDINPEKMQVMEKILSKYIFHIVRFC